MSQVLSGLAPEDVWRFFCEISAVPRESGNEDKIRHYLESFARRKGFSYKVDSPGNIVIKVPASKGYEKAPGLILQSHMDMVCVKSPDSKHDFRKDPIIPIHKDGWVVAEGTSLGADNGIGMAFTLAILDDHQLIHPKLEGLFTVNEEVGLQGAYELGLDMLDGDMMINLDAGEPDKPCIGAGGGIDSIINFKTPRENASQGVWKTIRVQGLVGGHTGDVYFNRANAIKLLSVTLSNIISSGVRIGSIKGGTRRNAIPTTAEASVLIPGNRMDEVFEKVKQSEKLALDEYSHMEKDITIELLDNVPSDTTVIHMREGEKLVSLLLALPHGPTSVFEEYKEACRTSNSLSIVENHSEFTKVITFTRSNSENAKRIFASEIRAICELAGAEISHENNYPAWEANPNSKLLSLYKDSYTELFSNSTSPVITHGGLEVGIIQSKYPHLDTICTCVYGKDPHSTSERILVESVIGTYKVLQALVTKIAHL